MKVYIVTSGEYSDYGIDAVFLTKEKAKLYVNAYKNDLYYYGDSYNIEEYETFDDNIYEKKDRKIVTLKYNNDVFDDNYYNVEIINLPIINNNNKIKENIHVQVDYPDKRTIRGLNFTKIVDSDKVKTEKQYKKILQDIVAETKNMLLEYDKNEMNYKIIASIEEALKQKYL